MLLSVSLGALAVLLQITACFFHDFSHCYFMKLNYLILFRKIKKPLFWILVNFFLRISSSYLRMLQFLDCLNKEKCGSNWRILIEVFTKFPYLLKYMTLSLVPITKVSINITDRGFFIHRFKVVLASSGLLCCSQSKLVMAKPLWLQIFKMFSNSTDSFAFARLLSPMYPHVASSAT